METGGGSIGASLDLPFMLRGVNADPSATFGEINLLSLPKDVQILRICHVEIAIGKGGPDAGCEVVPGNGDGSSQT